MSFKKAADIFYNVLWGKMHYVTIAFYALLFVIWLTHDLKFFLATIAIAGISFYSLRYIEEDIKSYYVIVIAIYVGYFYFAFKYAIWLFPFDKVPFFTGGADIFAYHPWWYLPLVALFPILWYFIVSFLVFEVISRFIKFEELIDDFRLFRSCYPFIRFHDMFRYDVEEEGEVDYKEFIDIKAIAPYDKFGRRMNKASELEPFAIKQVWLWRYRILPRTIARAFGVLISLSILSNLFF